MDTPSLTTVADAAAGESAPNPLDRLARELVGVDYLFPYQKLVVANILEGRDQIVILPTGAGKSLCFQLPARLLPGATVIVFPLISLIADQHRRLEGQGIPCAVLRGGQSRAERQRIWRDLRSLETKVLLTTPEALLVDRTLEELRRVCVSHLVVDEAHCVSEWGDTFRPSYLELGRVAAQAGIPLQTAFTATASDRVLARVREVLFAHGEVNLVRANPDRPNISYTVIPTLCKEHALTELIRRVERPALVFCRTRSSTERTCRLLRSRLDDGEIRFYHAGLSKPERGAIEQWFFHSHRGVLTATCAYGMGVDKADIRTVIHRDTPPSVEAFLQESGRAGRDRRGAASFLLFSREDEATAGRIVEPVARERYQALLAFALDNQTCRRERLLALLEAQPEYCFGCDVCDGRVITRPEGSETITAIVRRHRRRYTRREVVLLLSGRMTLDARLRGLDLAPHFGALAAWEPPDIETAVEELLRQGALRLISRGPWKYRLTAPPPSRGACGRPAAADRSAARRRERDGHAQRISL